MHTFYYSEQPITYDGHQLAPHWIYRRFDLLGDAIVALLVPLDAGLCVVAVGGDLHRCPRSVFVERADAADEARCATFLLHELRVVLAPANLRRTGRPAGKHDSVDADRCRR